MKVRFLLIKSSYLSPKRAQAVRQLWQRLRRRFCLDRKIKPHPAGVGSSGLIKKSPEKKEKQTQNRTRKTKQNKTQLPVAGVWLLARAMPGFTRRDALLPCSVVGGGNKEKKGENTPKTKTKTRGEMLRGSPARASWAGGGGGTPPALSDPCGDGEHGYTPGGPAASVPPQCPPGPLPVSAWQQEVPPLRSPPGFSCPPTGARHHWHRFRSRQQLQESGEGAVRALTPLLGLHRAPARAPGPPSLQYLLYEDAHPDEQHRGHH